VEARWVYDGQYRVASQLDASGAVTHRFVYGSQSHSPDYVVKSGVAYAYVKNHLGIIRFVVDSTSGVVAQQLDYDAWGNLLSDSSPGFQPFAFAGGLYDRDTKLTHFGFRDYDSTAGVWTAKDPIGLGGGLNQYSYCNSSPVRRIDPAGLDFVDLTPTERAVVTHIEGDPYIGPLVQQWLENNHHVNVRFEAVSCAALQSRGGGWTTDQPGPRGGVDEIVVKYNLEAASSVNDNEFGLSTSLIQLIAHELGHAYAYSMEIGPGGVSDAFAVEFENRQRFLGPLRSVHNPSTFTPKCVCK
jgi:RHS repeat-associated protein